MKRRGKKSSTVPTTEDAAVSGIVDDDSALFRIAVQDVALLPKSDKTLHTSRRPQPVPRQIPHDEQTVPDDSLSDHISLEMEAGDEWSFLRPGVSRQTLRRLRRGHWGIQAQLDLHGYTRDEARKELVAFLDAGTQRGFRCVRVIHGKGLGSKSHEPVLKVRIGSWLSQRDDVLAFCQARPEDGGSGAVLVLLKVFASGNAG
ncbi:Smr/MutS family protein [Nitrosospira sp. NpAV]|uniref:Smr/MutS family protein n=1 Tax=Nitrosospira sp. NpAV TaxID=58133 RepID=UPI0005A04992|nr:Smr/MutS family protein [Nitrosospira sp. NpAV]KIO49511.1 DNA mismatch repair protein MutS [Nitrosospira sp. NpAV]